MPASDPWTRDGRLVKIVAQPYRVLVEDVTGNLGILEVHFPKSTMAVVG